MPKVHYSDAKAFRQLRNRNENLGTPLLVDQRRKYMCARLGLKPSRVLENLDAACF